MAITQDDSIDKFAGSRTRVTISTGTAQIGVDAMSLEADNSSPNFTNVNDVREGSMILTLSQVDAPNVNGSIGIFARLMNIDGSNHAPIPATDFLWYPIGRFVVKPNTDTNRIPTEIYLPNSQTQQQYQFYYLNNTGQIITAGWYVDLEVKTLGPHA